MDDLRMGRAIQALRLRKGLTQFALARRAGISASTVSRIERGLLAGLTLRVLRSVAGPLGMRGTFRLGAIAATSAAPGCVPRAAC